jgi:EAL domain-containing protein (putative c-di-GMP-specific phosphodiesterase class I)
MAAGPASIRQRQRLARQVAGHGLVADVAEALDRSGLPAARLQLEITENTAMSHDGEAVDTLRAIAEMGVRIVIDDFGAGYSNLAYLRRLPVHALKVSGLFTQEAAEISDTPATSFSPRLSVSPMRSVSA